MIGRFTVKVEPSPNLLSTPILPECSSIRRFVNARPIPVPPMFSSPD